MKISLVFFSIFISSLIGEINKPLIEVRLNTSSTSTSIEWIPFTNNYEISISEFWNYMGDSERGEKAQQYIDYKKSKFKSPLKWVTLSFGIIGFGLVATDESGPDYWNFILEKHILTTMSIVSSMLSSYIFCIEKDINTYTPLSYIEVKQMIKEFNLNPK